MYYSKAHIETWSVTRLAQKGQSIMAIDKDLLAILCCPETKQTVTLADTLLIERLNEAIKSRRLQNKGKQLVTEPVEGGLLRADAKVLYPIRENIPVMLVEEGIPLEQVG